MKHTDKELLDGLERFIKGRPVTLWDGNGEFPGRNSPLPCGLAFGDTRTLREALESIYHDDPEPKETHGR